MPGPEARQWRNPSLPCGSRRKRSAAQQVEYWAALGRQVGEWLDPEQLLEVKTGLARLKLEPVRAAAVDP